MHNQRGFVGVGVLIAIILGIVVLGGGAYYVVQQQAPTQTASENFDNVQTLPTQNIASNNVSNPQPVPKENPSKSPSIQTVGDMSFSPPAWNKDAQGAFVSSDYKQATPPAKFELGMDYNPIARGAQIVVSHNVTEVADSIDTSEAYANFQFALLQDCSNCSGAKKMSIDGVPAVFSHMSFPDHGGSTSISGRFNHKNFYIAVVYAGSYADVQATFEQLIQSVSFKGLRDSVAATIKPSATIDSLVLSPTTRTITGTATGVSIVNVGLYYKSSASPLGWKMVNAENSGHSEPVVNGRWSFRVYGSDELVNGTTIRIGINEGNGQFTELASGTIIAQ